MGNVCRLVVPEFGTQRRDEHGRGFDVGLDAIMVESDALNQMIDKAMAGIMNQRHRMKEIVGNDRFEDIQLEVALRAGEADSRVVAMNLDRDHGHGLALSRVDFSRHDRRARLVFGKAQLAKSAARAGSQPTNVVGDLPRVPFIQPSGALSDGDLALSARVTSAGSVQN